MMKTEKKLSSLAAAALALDADFTEMERIAGQLERLEIESDNGLERARKRLDIFSERGARIGERVQALSSALEEARARVEKATQTVAARAELARQRQERAQELVARFEALGKMASDVSAELMPYRDQGSAGAAASVLPGIEERLGRILGEAAKLRMDARAANMRKLERGAESLGQTVGVARRKLGVALH